MGAVPFWGRQGSPDQEANLSDAAALGSADGPVYSSRPWDLARIAGRDLPGICDVKGRSIAGVEIDSGKAKGVNGARITVLGYKPGQFEITCETWTSDQWDVLQKVVADIWTPPAKKTKGNEIALQVYHPALAFLKVSAAVLQGVTPPERGSFEGGRVVRFQMYESVPPKASKPKVAKAPSVGRVAEYRSGEEPKNATPPPPSSNKKLLSSRGQPTPPESGSH